MKPKSGRRILMHEDVIPTFIEEVKKRECIWNYDDEKYNDRYEQMLAWKEISKVMNQPDDLLKSKWKNLRDIFKRELRGQRKKWRKDVESVEDYRGSWKLFPSMWFIHRPEDVVNVDLEDEPTEDTYEDNNEDENPLQDLVKCEPEEVYNEEDEELFVEVDPPDRTNRKRKRKGDEHDFDMMFLQSLTPFLRQLEPMRKLIVRSRIQEILINEIAAQNHQKSKNKNNNS